MRGDRLKKSPFVSRLGGFWYKSGTSNRARIMVFKSLILSTLYNGLETMFMSPAEYKTTGRMHPWLCEETQERSGHFQDSHRCRHNKRHSVGTRALAVGGLVSFCD